MFYASAMSRSSRDQLAIGSKNFITFSPILLLLQTFSKFSSQQSYPLLAEASLEFLTFVTILLLILQFPWASRTNLLLLPVYDFQL